MLEISYGFTFIDFCHLTSVRRVHWPLSNITQQLFNFVTLSNFCLDRKIANNFFVFNWLNNCRNTYSQKSLSSIFAYISIIIRASCAKLKKYILGTRVGWFYMHSINSQDENSCKSMFPN